MKYKNRNSALYILPLGMILISFYALPIIISFVLSFTKYNIMKPPEFIGIKNYIKLLSDEIFVSSLKNTLVFMLGVVPIQTVGAMLMAVWLTRWKKNPLARLVQSILFVPVISSMVLIGIVWRIMLNGDMSPLNIFVGWFGLSPDWLGNKHIALLALMAINIWKNLGYFMVLYISGLMDIPNVYYEAAEVDGANGFEKFFYITVPQLKHITVLVVFLGIIWTIQIFDLVYTLTGGGPGTGTVTMAVHIYNLNFKQFNTGYAMAVANVLFFINAVFAIMQKRFIRAEELG